MSTRAQRQQRGLWKTQQKEYRQRKKNAKCLETPPNSPLDHGEEPSDVIHKTVSELKLPTVTGTMRLHQILNKASGEIRYRDVSCSYGTKICKCFEKKDFKFAPQPFICFDYSIPMSRLLGRSCLITFPILQLYQKTSRTATNQQY